MAEIEIQADGTSLHRLVAALDAEEAGGKLRRDLARNLRKAVDPAAEASRREILQMRSWIPHKGESLRQAVADQVKVTTRLAGEEVGVKVRAGGRGPRGFRLAARRLNQDKGWRHPVYGNRQVWVHQIGKPHWFDNPIRARREEYMAAVLEAMQAAAERIARETG